LARGGCGGDKKLEKKEVLRESEELREGVGESLRREKVSGGSREGTESLRT
jgi:hypothetical protein